MQKKIDELFKLWKENEGAGGQLLVTYKGETVFDKCYGYANIETGTPITQDTVFHVASVTKQITVMCVMILHERGLLNVFDDVRKYIPDLIAFPQPMTLKNMMNNVSGLRDQWELLHHSGRKMEDALVQTDTRNIIARQRGLNFEPLEKYMYSNSNFTLLATIVERVSGKTLPEFAKENIFEPLGMTSTFIRDDFRMLVPNRAYSYHDDGYNYTNGVLTFGVYGSTSLHTTCRDFTKWLWQFKNPTLISADTMNNIMLDRPTLKDGTVSIYAGGVKHDYLEGHRFVQHGGANAGFRTFSMIFPEDDLTIVLLANTYNIPTEPVCMDIARIVLGLEPRKLNNLDEYETDGCNTEDIAGYYYDDNSGSSYDICVKDGVPYVLYEEKWVKLTHVRGNLYKMGRRNITFAFGEKCAVNHENSVMRLRKLTENVYQDYAYDYEGTYYSDEVGGEYYVSEESGKVYLNHRRFGTKELHWVKGDMFAYDSMDGRQEVVFTRGSGGNVIGFVHNSGRVQNLPFSKID